MSLKILEIVSNRLLEQKRMSELELENILIDKTMSPTEKVDLILNELDKLKDSSLKFTYWESFIGENIVLPENKKEVNN
jgi:hypothetical protein